jgi:hypothetical protein
VLLKVCCARRRWIAHVSSLDPLAWQSLQEGLDGDYG